MALIACTVKNIQLTTIINGGQYKGAIDREGYELPDVQIEVTDKPNKREYYCLNCMLTWDGSETFGEVKKHFGTFPID